MLPLPRLSSSTRAGFLVDVKLRETRETKAAKAFFRSARIAAAGSESIRLINRIVPPEVRSIDNALASFSSRLTTDGYPPAPDRTK